MGQAGRGGANDTWLPSQIDEGHQILVTSIDQLPRPHGKTLYLDTETTSGSPKLTSLDPWRNCSIGGIAITWDDYPEAYYVPVRCNQPYERHALRRESVIDWLRDVFNSFETWVNHNIKYDIHAIANDFGLEFGGRVIDTTTQAKILDSDRVYKGGYGLDVLSKQLLGKDISSYELSLQPYLEHSEDYGDIDPIKLGEYACQDVLTNRSLWLYIASRLPEGVKRVAETEIALTPVLVDMERRGMRVRPFDVNKRQMEVIIDLLKIDKKIRELTGRWVNTGSNPDMYDVICNIYGMPVLAYTDVDDEDGGEVGKPSFGKNVLKEYLTLDNAPVEFIELAILSRKLKKFDDLFLETYKAKNIDGILHPTFNQCVRTGRMSCSQPNMQQLSKMAKELIVPRDGNSFIKFDYSGIEFRTIVHYIQDKRAIQRFNDDPDADFHGDLANDVGVSRKTGKTLNFQTAFGGGKKKMIKALACIKEIVDIVRKRYPDASKSQLGYQCERYAVDVYDTYHRTLPTLKPTSYKAADACRAKGYVFNLFGRRRHIPAEFAHIAFNALNQSSAADLIKEKMVELHKENILPMVCQVHDELLFEGPTDLVNDPKTSTRIAEIMETRPIPLRVPIRVSIGRASTNWKDCAEREFVIKNNEEVYK